MSAGDVARLAADDDASFDVRSTTSGTRLADRYGRVTGVSNGRTSLKVTYRGKSSASCTQALYVYNWTTASWRRLSSRTVASTELETIENPSAPLADYVSGTSGDGDVARADPLLAQRRDELRRLRRSHARDVHEVAEA